MSNSKENRQNISPLGYEELKRKHSRPTGQKIKAVLIEPLKKIIDEGNKLEIEVSCYIKECQLFLLKHITELEFRDELLTLNDSYRFVSRELLKNGSSVDKASTTHIKAVEGIIQKYSLKTHTQEKEKNSTSKLKNIVDDLIFWLKNLWNQIWAHQQRQESISNASQTLPEVDACSPESQCSTTPVDHTPPPHSQKTSPSEIDGNSASKLNTTETDISSLLLWVKSFWNKISAHQQSQEGTRDDSQKLRKVDACSQEPQVYISFRPQTPRSPKRRSSISKTDLCRSSISKTDLYRQTHRDSKQAEITNTPEDAPPAP